MAITYVGTGSIVSGVNVALQPTPVAYNVGDALVYITGEHLGSDSKSAPAGWTQLSANSTITTVQIWGRIAQSTSETIPTVNWGATNRGAAFISVFRGLDTNFTSIMPGTSERTANTTANIVAGASSKLPTQAGLCIIAGVRDKAAAEDANVYTEPTGWDGILAQQTFAGTQFGIAAAYWIQPTATTLVANTAITGSVTGASNAMAGTMIALAPAASGGGGGGGTGTVAFPPPKRRTYIIYDNYYPR